MDRRPTKRTNLFFKVQVEHDASELPERIGEEISRQLRKLYGVQDAEFTNFSRADE